MPKSRKNTKRKEQLKKYKTKHKKMTNQPSPEVRNFPVWKSTDTIVMSGAEWKVISDFVNSAIDAYSAVNQVMSRNIVEGNITLSFEKFNKDKGVYEPMSDEDQAPYQADVQKAIQVAKTQLNQPQDAVPSQDTTPDAPKEEAKVVQLYPEATTSGTSGNQGT